MSFFSSLATVGALVLAASATQAAPTFNYQNMHIVEGVGLVDKYTGGKYITLGMSRSRVLANAPQATCLADWYCEVVTSANTGNVVVYMDAAGKVYGLRFFQNHVAHKWPSSKGAVDGMTLAQVHAIYKGSTLTSDTDPTVSPANGEVRTRNGNYAYQTYTACLDSGCQFVTVSEVSRPPKP